MSAVMWIEAYELPHSIKWSNLLAFKTWNILVFHFIIKGRIIHYKMSTKWMENRFESLEISWRTTKTHFQSFENKTCHLIYQRIDQKLGLFGSFVYTETGLHLFHNFRPHREVSILNWVWTRTYVISYSF